MYNSLQKSFSQKAKRCLKASSGRFKFVKIMILSWVELGNNLEKSDF